jgi:hypothetical protein
MAMFFLATVFSPTKDIGEWITISEIPVVFFFGFRANGMVGRRLLKNGWEFADPDSKATLEACTVWGLPRPEASN